MTPKQAAVICEAMEVEALLENDEERELLSEHNPDLLDAYLALVRLAIGARG